MIMQKRTLLPLLHRQQQDDYNHVQQLNFIKLLFAFQVQLKFQ